MIVLIIKEDQEFQRKLNALRALTGLTYYWPVKNGVMADVRSGLNTTSSGTPAYTSDRIGKANDAIYVSDATNYWHLPNGVFFSSDFTITA